MTISTERRATPIILGTGANADIPFDFKVFRAEDILLVKSDGLNIESTLVLGNDYSVVLNPNQNEDAGGFVKLKVALATGERAIITTNAPSLQETRLINQGGFYPDVLNNAFDYLTILIQQLETQIKRVVLLPITTKIDKEKFTRNLAFLTEHVNELDALFNILSHIVIVSRISKEVVVVSKIEKDVTAVANNNTNVTKVADNETNINKVSTNETNINIVSLNIDCLDSICKNMLALLAVCKNETNITKVANNEPNINKVSTNEPNINKVAGNETNINKVVNNETNINKVANNETNINKVSNNETNITKTAANETNINKLVANETNINTVASIDSDVTTVAKNVADVTNFSDVYLGKRNVKPTTRTDKTPLETGDLYFDTVKKSIFVYDASLKDWILISSIINAILKQFYFVATAGQNVFKGNDDNNKLLEFELDYIEIFLNGVHLNPEDFTLDTTNQSITLKEVASEKDELYVRSFGALALPSDEIKNILTIKQKILDVSAKLKEIEAIEKKLKEIAGVHGVVKEIGGLAKIQIELKLLHDHINELKVLFGALSQIKTIAADLKNIDTVATKLKTKIDIIVKDKEAIDKVALIDGEIKTIFNNLDAILNRAGAVVNATELMAGIAKIATQAETTAGIIDNKIVTPLKLEAVLAALELNIREELSELKKVGDVYAKEIDKNSNRLVTHRTDIQQNTTDIVSNTASIATIIDTLKKGITTDKLAQSFTVPSGLHDKIQLDGEENTGNYGYSVAMGNNYLAIADPINQEVVIYHRDDNNIKLWNLEDVHRSGKHGDVFVEDGQVYVKRKDGVHLDVFEYDETQTNLTFKKVSTINLTGSFGNSLAIDDEYLIVGNPQASTALIYKHSGIQWQLVEKLSGGTSFGSDVAINHKYVLVSEVANKKAEVYKISRTFDFSAERVTGRFEVNVDVYLNAPTASTTGFLGYTVADDDGVNFYQVVMAIGTTTAYTRTYTATVNGAYATTNIDWFYQITDVNALGNINQAKNPRIYFIENNKLYVGVYLEGGGEWALIYKDVSTNQVHTTYSGKKAIRSEIGVIFTEKDFNRIMSRTNRTYYSDTNQEGNKEITDRFYHSEADSLAYSGNDHAYFSIEEKNGTKKQYNVTQDIITPTCFVRIKGLNGVWGGWATANGTRPADPIQLEVLPPTAIKHFKTLTGGASYSKLIDLTDDLSAFAEPDNNILKIYENLAEIASKTVKADCVNVGKGIVLATSKTDKKAYIYDFYSKTGWFTTTKTKWAGLPDNAKGYTGYNITGGQYQLVRPVGTTDTYTKHRGGAWVKNGKWGGVLWYLGSKIGFGNNNKKSVYLDTLDGKHYFQINILDFNSKKTTGRFKTGACLLLNAPIKYTRKGVVGYTVADDNGVDFYQLCHNLDSNTVKTRKFTNANNGTWSASSKSSFEQLTDELHYLTPRNVVQRYYLLKYNSLRVGVCISDLNRAIYYTSGFLSLDVETNRIFHRCYDNGPKDYGRVEVSDRLTLQEFKKILSITDRNAPDHHTMEVRTPNKFKTTRNEQGTGGTSDSDINLVINLQENNIEKIFQFTLDDTSSVFIKTKQGSGYSGWQSITGSRQSDSITKTITKTNVEVNDLAKFDNIMETVAPLSTLPDPIPQANRNIKLTNTDIQEQPNKTGNYVSLLGTGTATTPVDITKGDTNFTIGNNYGDACAITTDKVLITNKTDSKLVIYDHKGTKEKEIQLEVGVGSVIDATDTEAVVGSEKANKFEAISLT